MYLWRPNDSEIENYRISESIELLKKYIRDLYGSNTIFKDYFGNILVKEKWNDGKIYELGFIAEIKELK